ncbi:hypothetical protein H6P81_018597 [Aristolochia fimbriata]|uniref:Dolichyl-diphosphooligosaccharide--protein glycosyltransferase subunit 4 n=1 Tax=Aristolochia fimbriata TaxID=158543 RepID=A0AAV7E5U4_ARIFI|nr:hypothetical protein H6P81_018597 [Aristolochia fimbriata]
MNELNPPGRGSKYEAPGVRVRPLRIEFHLSLSAGSSASRAVPARLFRVRPPESHVEEIYIGKPYARSLSCANSFLILQTPSLSFGSLDLQMIDDQDLGFFANFLGIFIFLLVIAYHYVMADPKYEGN